MTQRDLHGSFAGSPIQIFGTIVGAEDVERRLRSQLPANAQRNLRSSVHALGFLLERRVKLEKLNGQVLRRRSGRLARSINTRFVDSAHSSYAYVGTSLRYGRIWELTGSRAFTIVPKNKKALMWPGALHPVRSVVHPAQAPRPFLKPTLDEMRPTIRATIERALSNLGAY
jgi:phage gpG-like protein